MLGRRLDRYVTGFFAWHFVLCAVAVLGLYIVVDTFMHIDDFVEHGGVLDQVRWIAIYHAYQVPALLSQFLPIVTLLAGIIALARLARHNELSAMKAAGVSIHRTLLPVFLVSLAIGVLGAADQELLVPHLEPDIASIRRSLRSNEYRDLFVYDEQERTGIWVRRLFNGVQGYDLHRLEAAPEPPAKPAEAQPAASLQCQRAVWADTWLFLFDGQMLHPDGSTTAFAHKALRAGLPATEFAAGDEPPARLGDGTPAFVVPAVLNGRPYGLRFAAFDPRPSIRLIRGAQVSRVYEGEQTAPPIAVLTALWDDDERQWLASAQTYVQVTPEKRLLKVFDGDPITMPPPQELIRSKTDPGLKSFGQLRRLARQIPVLRQRILVELNARLAFPLANFVLLLVAIPFLFQQEGGRSTWLGVGLALFVSVSFYFLNYASQLVGRNPEGIFAGVPWLAAWLPILIFGLAGAILLFNMDT